MLIFVCVMVLSFTSAHAQLVLNVVPDQHEYVIREPIRLRVGFLNVGNEEVRMLALSRLAFNNMEDMFLEVIGPDGDAERRRLRYASYDRIIDAQYKGEGVLPGEEVVVHLYPVITAPVDAEGRQGPNDYTFSKAGEYRFRVGYEVPDYYEDLWHPDGGVLFSEEIMIIVRQETSQEREILDAYWAGNHFDLVLPEDNLFVRHDASVMENVIARYPEDPLVRYVKLLLARLMLSGGRDDSKPRSRGVELLEELIADNPTFRFHEARIHLSAGYTMAGDYRRATRLLEDTLRQMPALVDSYIFAQRVFEADSSAGVDAYKRWRSERRLAGNRWNALPVNFRAAQFEQHH